MGYLGQRAPSHSACSSNLGEMLESVHRTVQLDSAAVVSVINTGAAKDTLLAHLLRCLFFLEAKYLFQAVAAHVPGVQNTLADGLSRDHMLYSLLRVYEVR